VLPATSEKSPSNKVLLTKETNDHGLALSQVVKTIMHRGANWQDKTINSYEGKQLNGLLKNAGFASIKECDPASNDPDIGILCCDAGYECVFDQASRLGGICASTSRELQEPSFCFLCDYGSVLPAANYDLPVQISGYEGLTCGSLNYAAYTNVTLDASTCGPTGQIAQEAGCCASYDCDVCGDLEFLADAVFVIDGVTVSCARLPGTFNDTLCATYSSYFVPACCSAGGDETAGGSSVVPTSAPVAIAPSPADPADTPAPAPSSDSSGMWAAKSTLVLSMMSLTVAAAGSLLLN
jgi:hypothetical protein